ncbi:MAG: hypothetical protein ABH811_01880 [archaeon]
MKNKRNKKGVSIMIGYVLLVAFAVIMGIVVYQWIKTYVPKQGLECPEGVSLFIKDYNYDCTNKILTLNLINTGRFNIDGYYVYATNNSNQVLAANDISKFASGDIFLVNRIVFDEFDENSFMPNEEVDHSFDLSESGFLVDPSSNQQIYSIEIIPTRSQIKENKKRIVSCDQSKVKEIVSCN